MLERRLAWKVMENRNCFEVNINCAYTLSLMQQICYSNQAIFNEIKLFTGSLEIHRNYELHIEKYPMDSIKFQTVVPFFKTPD